MKRLKIFRVNRGELVLLITVACLGVVDLITARMFHDENYYLRERWPIPAGFLLSAGIVRILTRSRPFAPANQPQDWLISSSSDHAPGGISPAPSAKKWKFFREGDRFILVPVRFWPWILCGVGILYYVLPRYALE
ncbi:MAG: hypothetical protein ACLQHF_12075 [Terracidiphilus sp.]